MLARRLFFTSIARLTVAAALTVACQPGRAQAADAVFTFDLVTSRTVVAPDGTWTVDTEATIKAPADNPSRVIRVPLVWSRSIEDLNILDARIEKPNGPPSAVAPDAIRDDPLTGDRYFHEFSDLARKTITFSNVDAGDVLRLQTVRRVHHPRVPGGFAMVHILDPSVRWEEISDTVISPDRLPLKVESRGFDHQSEKLDGRTAHYFHSSKAVPPERSAIGLGAFDRLPYYAVSSFPDWDAFGKSMAGVLLPHAKVTPAIQALADKLTAGQTSERARAEAIFDWMRTRVARIPMPLEEGKPVPNDAETVMTRLYGNDQDHAVLLTALLAAKGIRSEICLLNATDTANIAEAPNIRPMNHLIIYFPGLDLYGDATLGVAPLGILPFRQIGKPVIHLGGTGPARRTIPIPAAASTHTEMVTDATLAPNGAIEGRTETTAAGPFAIWLRGAAQNYGNDARRNAAAVTLLREHGTPGAGNFSFDDPAAGPPVYTVSGTFKLREQPALLSGGFFSLWTGLRVLPRPGDFLAGSLAALEGGPPQPIFCYPGTQREELRLTLPEGRTPGSLPPDMVIDNDLVRFRSHWTWDGQRIATVREFESKLPGPACDASVREKLAKTLNAIRDDLTTKVGISTDLTVPRPWEQPKSP